MVGGEVAARRLATAVRAAYARVGGADVSRLGNGQLREIARDGVAAPLCRLHATREAEVRAEEAYGESNECDALRARVA